MYSKVQEIRTATRCLTPELPKDNDDDSADSAVHFDVSFDVCDGNSLQKWNHDGATGRIVNVPLKMCLHYESSTGKKEKKEKEEEKSLLNFLANVATEVALEPERPKLVKCELSTSQWRMDKPFEWRKRR